MLLVFYQVHVITFALSIVNFRASCYLSKTKTFFKKLRQQMFFSHYSRKYYNSFGQPEARSIEDTWTKKFNLSVLDISNNRNWWKISNSSFKAMVNMKDLRLSECCSAEQNFVSDFLRDLVNIERLDISFNSWNLSFYDSLFFSLEHLIYLNISGKESSRNR